MSEVAAQTLHIVARELNNELNDARAALENFGEHQDDVRYLENCRERLHAVHGALRVAEVYGAALLAEEMEQLARYLVGTFAEKRHLAEGLDALMRAMVQLPTYLERVLGGGRDMALILLPLLNDLRAVRGHALLSEGTLLLLNLTSEKQANPLPPAPGEHVLPVANWARKLRPRYQLGLLGWIKGERVEQNLEILARAAEKLEQVATTQSVFQLWWVIGAVIEALADGGLEGSASIKRLLGQADRELKRLYEQGEAQYAERPPVELLNNLLYYLARSATDGPRASAVRASFRLDDLLPVDQQVEAARESLAAPSIKLMKTVAAAIKEDLARVKDALDIFVRKKGTQAAELAPQLELLRKIGDTLGVLGLASLRDKVQDEMASLQKVVASNTPVTEAMLMRMASTLINIETGLDEQLVGLILPAPKTEAETQAEAEGRSPSDEIEFRQVTEAVLRECIVNMARIKEAIALSVERPKEAQVLEQVPPLIHGITAGLLMLGKTRAVELTEAVGKALPKYVRADGVPVSHEAMDRLADAIVAVEYYMETLHAGRTDPWYMLDNAEACLQALSDLHSGSELHALHDVADFSVTMAVEPTVSASTVVLDRADRTAVLGSPESPQATQVIPSQQAAKRASLQETRVMPDQKGVKSTGKSGAPSPVLATSIDQADAEFVELFIEEAREEISKLQSIFPLWDENPQDAEALANIRRSFHTLKGSGRMVGAQVIGDFAWAVENMLNRVINKTLPRSPEMMQVMRAAVAVVPQLVEQLESGRAPQMDVSALIAQANSIAMVREANAAAPVEAEPGDETATTQHVATQVRPAASVVPKSESLTVSPKTPPKSIVTPVMPPIRPAAPAPEPMDDVLREIFTKETAGHLKSIREYIGSCALLTPPYPVTDTLHRACHTLSGTAKTAGARQGIKIAEPLNRYIRKLYDNNLGLPAAGMQVLRDSVRAIENVVEHIGESTGFFITHTSIIERIGKLEEALDTELATLGHSADATAITPGPAIKMADTESHDDVVELSFDAETEHRDLGIDAPTAILHALQADDGSSTAEVMIDPAVMRDGPAHVASSTDSTSRNPIVRGEATTKIEALTFDADIGAHTADAEAADLEVEDIDLSAEETPPAELVVETAAWAANYEPPSLPQDRSIAANEPHIAEDAAKVERAKRETAAPPQPASIRPASVAKAAPVAPPVRQIMVAPEPEDDESDEDFDADVAAIFTEEAAELLEVADASLSSWSRDLANSAVAFELKRALHTLKGGARMAGIRAMGDLSHELESFMQGVESGQIAPDPQVLDLLQASLDELHRMRDTVSGGRRAKSARELIARIRVASGHAQTETIASAHVAQEAEPDIVLESTDEPPSIDVVLESTGASNAHLDFELPAEDASAPMDEIIEIGSPEEIIVEDEAAQAFAETELPPAVAVKAHTETAQPYSIEPQPHEAAPIEQLDVDAAAGMQQSVALPPGRDSAQQERGEVARVDAELLDMLLNNAGEVSILRSRLEQQTNSIDSNLAELGRTVARLKEQLRKLEFETEAQILHRHQEENAGRTDFDPLELDRYSQLQQLSRALAESVSDVASIEGLLENQVREAQNLLLQQSRVVTEVQNGLMKTRMVPFQRHVQRLSRIVRQVAGETGKRADLVVSGASGELDRQVLERMLPPLEHMLRNSVVHGIETPHERKAAGKPEVGTIRIDLHREGSEMVILVGDDGRGIDVKAVRARAIERGLLKAGRTISDEEALQLILEPGFSTAQTVTQHAGRGVGMDVVVAEIKKLGGALFTKSTLGHGVRFTIRLPFTLAISQSLIVRVVDETYALPLSTVEGVARVPRSEVAAYLSQAEPVFNYGGQPYRVQHLGAFIDAPASTLPDADVPVPLILVNAGEHSTALVVDELVGNREIVVKPVGPQISGVRGVSGATILGDGRIVVILDMGALVRSGWRIRSDVAAPLEDRRTFALVVDDSITVRRVTQRLLERNGMRVMTAKDGVDALAVMQEHVPDIILLDIEMPRMDGYELAAQVRNDPRLADVPIIMITSRVGEKHRARAIELGVNDYLGKPYQENQLLDSIEPLVDARRRRTAAGR